MTLAVAGTDDRARRRERLGWLLVAVASLTAAVLAVLMFRATWESTTALQRGLDLEFYRNVATRWLETGSYYLPRQLDGTGQLTLNLDVLYPPSALFLFVPFVWLPAFVWWLGPAAIVVVSLMRLRPASWSWPILILSLAWPRTAGAIVFGDSDIWFAAFVWAGAAFSWTGVLVSMKPSVLPFGLIGIRRRSWWIAAAVFALVNLPLIGLWAEYPTVVRSAGVPVLYSIGNLPMFIAPIVAWFARRRSNPAVREPHWTERSSPSTS
jgi:hypothetical protein